MRELKFQYGENILISFRNGSLVNFLAKELVCGDIVVIATGDRVPADIRLVEAVDLEIDESSFTEETEPQRKYTSSIPEALANSSLTEQKKCCVYGHVGSLWKWKGEFFVVVPGRKGFRGCEFHYVCDGLLCSRRGELCFSK
ncbi:calcium-transporting ATPase type 2C member 1-like isoform X1 [Xenia sp. Carnegie-2017]|uniref:calcium-transporting ATPase type 2C member 1-like isoform X1 n=1 Tax=Xenia sp. Carnegie-2017 TaxID=2897299 RepID=UPI001F03E7A5|nr:calcium-transporting ATPase type 2C member 1-like isoform X1 [Xenia sp. Carnegie-2017]